MIEILLQAERALEMGRIDAAETLYRQVADADPRNAIAVVGLARVTLERGDEAGALVLAHRALAIDPENSAAGRMVTRLEEVRAYRGEPEPAPVPAPERAPEPASEPEPATASEPAVAAPPAEPTPRPEPAPVTATPTTKARRSWIDRLLRRHR